MRVSAGKYKGRLLSYPRSGLRPTKGITRQAIFNIVGRKVRGARACDLYAGGGSLGIEALSRGAEEVVFVEVKPVILRFLRLNTKGLTATKVVRGDVLKVLARLGRPRFDLVLADPPYLNGFIQATLDQLLRLDLVSPGGLVVLEHHRLEPPSCPDGWEFVKQGKYGDSMVSVLRRPDG